MNFLDLLFSIPLFIVGMLLVIWAVYGTYISSQFKKYGAPVKLRVKDVKEKKNNDGTRRYYITTFEFEFNGEMREKVLQTIKKFKVGDNKKGLFLNNRKNNNLSVGGEGFYMAPGAGIILFLFGMLLIIPSLNIWLKLPTTVWIIFTLTIFVICFGYIFVYNHVLYKIKQEKTNKKAKIYHGDVEDEYSQLPAHYIRYMPKPKSDNDNNSKRLTSSVVVGTVISLIFSLCGCLAICYGVTAAQKTINIKSNWNVTTAVVKDVYTYTTKTDEGETREAEGFIYSYVVEEKTYELNKKGKSSFEKHKLGQEVKLYYNPEDYNEACLREGMFLDVGAAPLGIAVIYMACYPLIDKRNRGGKQL